MLSMAHHHPPRARVGYRSRSGGAVRRTIAWFGLVGCGGGAECEALSTGRYTADGSAFGMAMEVVVTLDEEGCGFTFSEWSMAMTDLPSGGLVAGTTVTLLGSAAWESCTGEVDADGGVQGTCGDGGTFGLVRLF